MRKLVSVVVLALAVAAVAAAKPRIPSMQEEVASALEQYSPKEIGALTVGELEQIAQKVALAHRKASFVSHSAMMSMMMPGMGQVANGDRVGGALFAGANLAIAAGSIAAAWLLLPADVQPQSLFIIPVGDITPRLETHTPLEYLPAFGAMAGGMLLDGILRVASARHAASLARRNIAEGKLDFSPEAGVVGPGFMMGMRDRVKR